MRRTIGFLLGVFLLGGCAVYADPVPRAGCLRGSAAGGGHRAAALVGMGLAWPVALMRDRRRAPTCPGRARDSVRGTTIVSRQPPRRCERPL
jgi:hypothetical protein